MMFVPNQFVFPYAPINSYTPMKPSNTDAHQRSRFTKEEDELLKQLVESQRKPNYSEISKYFQNRTARQCRERYNYYLRPDLINGPWTQEEEELLAKLYEQYGPKWALISQSFDSRSPVNIKNHHSSMISRAALKTQKVQQPEVAEEINATKSVSVDEKKSEIEPNFDVNDGFDDGFANFGIYEDIWPSSITQMTEDDLLAF